MHIFLSIFRTYKNVTLQERYPNICEKLYRNETHICQQKRSVPNAASKPFNQNATDFANGGGASMSEAEEKDFEEDIKEQENALINDPEVRY